MIKLFGISIKAIFTYLANFLTCYYFINLFKVLMPFNQDEIDIIKIVGSAIVALSAAVYWVVKIIHARASYKKEQYLLDLRIDVKKRYLNRKNTQDDMDDLMEMDDKYIRK